MSAARVTAEINLGLYQCDECPERMREEALAECPGCGAMLCDVCAGSERHDHSGGLSDA